MNLISTLFRNFFKFSNEQLLSHLPSDLKSVHVSEENYATSLISGLEKRNGAVRTNFDQPTFMRWNFSFLFLPEADQLKPLTCFPNNVSILKL